MAWKGTQTGQKGAKAGELGRVLGRPSALVGWTQGLIRFFLAAALTGGQVLAGRSPFALALVGASGAGSEGFAALLGGALGYLLTRGPEEGLRYAACCILVFSVAFAFFDLRLYQKQGFMPLVTGGLCAVTGLVTLVAPTPTAVAALLGETAVSILCVYAFRSAFSLWNSGEEPKEPGARQRLGLIVLGLAVLISLARLELLGQVSVGRICAAGLSLCAGWSAGPGAGAAVGLSAGLAMDLSGDTSGLYAVSYALAALVAGLLRTRRRWLCAGAFALAGAMCALWSGSPVRGAAAVYEGVLAALLFLLIPQRLLDQAGVLFAPDARWGKAQWTLQAASRRLRQAADAFDQVFSSLRTAFDHGGDNGEDPSIIYDRCANRVCARCTLRERCWQRDYQDTHDLLNAALPPMLERRQARAEDFPQRFRDKCCRFAAFLTATNEELSAHLLRRRYQKQVGRSRQAVCDQYGDMARVFQEAAAAMAAPLAVDDKRTRRLRQYLAGRELSCRGLVFTDPQGHLRLQLEGWDARTLADEAGRQALSQLVDLPLAGPTLQENQVLFRQLEPLTALAGAAGRARQGQSASGDAFSWFKDPQGVLYVLLCDGMGSGPQARQESELCLKLLEKFLRAGMTAQNALKTLDQALVLRGEETGTFSTVDLLELDLYTGRGGLYKLGACPSYLKRGGTVKCLSSLSLPAGLTGPTPRQCHRLDLQMDPGDCLVLLTDGVVQEEDGWLRTALLDFDGASPADLAQVLVDHDREDLDDKTALVLRLGLRPQQAQAASAQPDKAQL